jgi:hypothetical protein
VPGLGIGNQIIDDGNFIFSGEEKNEFLKIEPDAERLFRPLIGATELINGYSRWCLRSDGCAPCDLERMPEVKRRADAVREFRHKSRRAGTRAIADTPWVFNITNMPESDYLAIPRVSSCTREYIPVCFMPPETIATDSVLIMRGAGLYHFGVLMSGVHMAWVRVVCGRLETSYRYSKDIVYNNFPWPDSSDTLIADIETASQGVLEARATFPGRSLADLYDPRSMPQALRNAHDRLDSEVGKAYGFGSKMTDEADTVSRLMKMFRDMTSGSGK